MAAENFSQALHLVLADEGGYVNLAADPGGATNKGITQHTYDVFNAKHHQTKRSVREITQHEAEQIYREQYAAPIRFDDLPAGVDYALFDFAVNSGVARAVKTLQSIIGTRQDGIVGMQTLSAIPSVPANVLINKLCDARLAFMRSLKTWKTFGRGWNKRVERVRSNALSMSRYDVKSLTAASEGASKADGAQSLAASIKDSRRSKSAVAGVAGTALAAISEAMELARPAQEVVDYARYAGLIGLLIVVAALVYIIWVRSHAAKD
ncbi:MAG: glycoside hydrolase family 108 protein [Cardiobacteriaceae bacterium]|nr:glycoside hydrolase family 108 protein [Cardiobacteriaceae bacterium]